MTTRTDPFTQKSEPPDRLFFATGVMLDAQDFEAEQLYHRGRLARALAYTFGSGTVAGLGVAWASNRLDALNQPIPGTDRVSVEPGMAIDRLGRIIELPRAACLRLQKWYDAQSDTALAESYRTGVSVVADQMTQVVTAEGGIEWTITAGSASAQVDGVVVDVFVRFVACERGKTPAFAAGPFDALDAVQPSRLRDGYELTLVPRRVTNPDMPVPSLRHVPSFANTGAERRAHAEDAILAGWRELRDWTNGGLIRDVEQPATEDPTILFLARMVLPATLTPGVMRPVRTQNAPVLVNNHLRRFVVTGGALGDAFSWARIP